MNALRQIIEVDSSVLSILLPKEYQKQTLEVIILPFNNQNNEIQNIKARKQAFDIIDKGIIIENQDTFLSEFYESRQDRTLPFRD
jgi:hypothetical protein